LAFLEQRQTNGVVERFSRTSKEQVVYDRVCRTVEGLRKTVEEFIELYNREWRTERQGSVSSAQARKNILTRLAA